MIDSIPRWPHQLYAVLRTQELMEQGVRRILVTTPTGGGKSLEMIDTALKAIRDGWGVVLFANRKLLIDQFVRTFGTYGIDYGIRAADHLQKEHEPFQLASIQTEHSRVVKKRTWEPHPCRIILVDEAHMQNTPQAEAVFARYADAGATKIGYTATPLGLDGCYDQLVIAGNVSQLRACGALVPATHFGCTEPDLRNIGRVNVGEDLTDPQNVKAIMVPGIHGRVIDWYRRTNPHGLPSLGFAPGVPESVGFAEAFCEAGIPAAHIDGDRIWVAGTELPSNEKNRNDLLQMSRLGKVRIIWNRFVLREAVDMPWLQHGILATVFGSLQSYLQSGGRLLRSCAGKARVVVQDHGGNWWRHGSLNDDRNWHLTDTNRLLANQREDEMAGNDPDKEKRPEPFLCPRCGTVLSLAARENVTFVRCAACGHVFDFSRRSRPVLQTDGELVEHVGNIWRPKRVEMRPTTHADWERMYWRAKNANMTFRQAAGLFFHENGYYPPRTLPLMPKTSAHWDYYVKRVAFGLLIPKGVPT